MSTKIELNLGKQPQGILALLSNVLLLPFWYIAIYLLAPELHHTKNTVAIILAVCISLIIISSLMVAFLIILGIPSYRKNHLLDAKVTLLNLFIQIVLISGLLFLVYTLNAICNTTINFYDFLLIYFGILALFVFVFLIRRNVFKEKWIDILDISEENEKTID